MSSILFYVVGDKTHGMGHVVRCLTLAAELGQRGHGVSFATEYDTPGHERIRRAGRNVYGFARYDLSWARQLAADIIIIDIEGGPPRDMLAAARPYHAGLVVVGGSGWLVRDREAIRELSDLFVCQTILATDGDLTGPEHIIIDPAFAGCKPNPDGHILVSFGGSDPHGLRPLVVPALFSLGRNMVVVNGPASSPRSQEAGADDECAGVAVVHAPPSLVPHLDGAALFVGAMGMSAFEAAAAGVPAILTAWSRDHEATARGLQARGAARSIGTWDELDRAALALAAEDVLSDDWATMSRAGRALVDGRGAARVADGIERTLQKEEGK